MFTGSIRFNLDPNRIYENDDNLINKLYTVFFQIDKKNIYKNDT